MLLKTRILSYKICAFIIASVFVFNSLHEVNSHTYSTGIDSYHYECGCFGCWKTHLAVKCNTNYRLHF